MWVTLRVSHKNVQFEKHYNKETIRGEEKKKLSDHFKS